MAWAWWQHPGGIHHQTRTRPAYPIYKKEVTAGAATHPAERSLHHVGEGLVALAVVAQGAVDVGDGKRLEQTADCTKLSWPRLREDRQPFPGNRRRTTQ